MPTELSTLHNTNPKPVSFLPLLSRFLTFFVAPGGCVCWRFASRIGSVGAQSNDDGLHRSSTWKHCVADTQLFKERGCLVQQFKMFKYFQCRRSLMVSLKHASHWKNGLEQGRGRSARHAFTVDIRLFDNLAAFRDSCLARPRSNWTSKS